MFYNRIIKRKEQTRNKNKSNFTNHAATIYEIKEDITELFKSYCRFRRATVCIFERHQRRHVIAKSPLVNCKVSFGIIFFVSSLNEAGSSFHTFAPIPHKAFCCISNLDFFK